MAVTGVHTLLYSSESEALQDVLRDVFGLTFMCDDLAGTMAELAGKGIVFSGDPEDQRWGTSVTMVLPGKVDVMLYEPRHPSPT
jgi:hypothetical protein